LNSSPFRYVKPKGSKNFKMEAPAAAIERLVRDKISSKVAGACSHTELLRLFRHYDRDGSGAIDIHEFKKMMGAFNINLTNKAAKEMFTRYDKDGQGTISYEEFKTQVMGEADKPVKPRVCPTSFVSEPVDYMCRGGGRGLEITDIDWHNGKVNAAPSLIEKVMRQKLFERTGSAANYELRRTWNLIDSDGSKKIDMDELDGFLKKFNINMTRKKLKELFHRYDVNGDGFIDQAEFENGVLNGRFPKKMDHSRHFAGQLDLDTRPATAKGVPSRALRNGGITGVDFSGHVSGATKPEQIERTLRTKLRERSEGRSCHELHRVWQQYDKDFDHRVDINEFKQILVAFNIHPADAMLRQLFRRYDANDDGLIERAEFENAVLNGILPRGAAPSRAKSSIGGNRTDREADQALDGEREALEFHARQTMGLLQQAKEANRRVLELQNSGGFSSRSRTMSRQGRRPGTVPIGTGRSSFGGPAGRKPNFTLDLTKAEGL